jgi:hypothetical protein
MILDLRFGKQRISKSIVNYQLLIIKSKNMKHL